MIQIATSRQTTLSATKATKRSARISSSERSALSSANGRDPRLRITSATPAT